MRFYAFDGKEKTTENIHFQWFALFNLVNKRSGRD